MDATQAAEIDLIILRLCKFYEGGLSYESLQNMPIPRLIFVNNCMNKIQKEMESDMNKRFK